MKLDATCPPHCLFPMSQYTWCTILPLLNYSYANTSDACLQEFDNCGASVANIGDMNRDDKRSRHPSLDERIPRPRVNDLIIGCSQALNGGQTGRTMVLFLREDGTKKGYKVFASTDDYRSPPLVSNDNFGAAVANYTDIDSNGLSEIVVGAPGDHKNGGAIYILFPRRRRYHAPVFDYITYYLILVLPFVAAGCCCCCCVMGICWYFRRKKTEVEEAIEEVGVETGIKRKRKKHKKEKKEENIDYYYN